MTKLPEVLDPANFNPPEWVLAAMLRAYQRGHADGRHSGKALYGIREASEATIRAYHAPHRALTSGEHVVDDGDWDDDSHDDESALQCAFCAEPLGTEPTERVETGPDGEVETWHARCAKEQCEVPASPVDPVHAEGPL